MPSKSPKLMLGWIPSPIGGIQCVQQGFMDSIFNFIVYDTDPTKGRQMFDGYTTAQTGYIPGSRNMLVEMFLDKSQADWFVMFDWDITFVPEDIYKLVDAATENSIVSGVYLTYFGSDNLLRPCWFHQEGDDEYVPVTEFTEGKIVPITVCGMGFTIMHRTLLEKMREAYEYDPWIWFGHDIIGQSRTGEDLTFCTRARRVGAEIYGHGGILLGHTKAKTLRPQDMADKQYARSTPSQVVLSVGAGGDTTAPGFEGWKVERLDIDPDVNPDILADGRDLSKIKDGSYDGVYCSHNIEHYPEKDIPKVLRGFHRVLRSGGKVAIRTPDIQEVNEHLANGKTEEDVAYQSPSGPITYGDIIHGWSKQIEAGNEFYKHLALFDKHKLGTALQKAGFKRIEVQAQDFELVATAQK